jgi:RNA polymerase sigma-70 factor, ECF subfamily
VNRNIVEKNSSCVMFLAFEVLSPQLTYMTPSTNGEQSMRSFAETTSLTLIDRVRQADPSSWNIFVEIYHPLVRYWCRKSGVKEHDVDDVAQEVFTAVSKSLSRFRKESSSDTFRGWLRQITRHKTGDYMRRVYRDLESTGGEDHDQILQQLPHTEPQTDPEEQLAAREVWQRAFDMVRSGTEERTWKAFWRTTVDELNATEVADELGMSPAAVRKAKSRMAIRLRLELGPLLDEIAQHAGVQIDRSDD